MLISAQSVGPHGTQKGTPTGGKRLVQREIEHSESEGAATCISGGIRLCGRIC